MKSERVENWWCGFEWCILNTEKLWNSNKFKKMKSLCNRRVSVWNPDISKEIVRFVHEVIQFFLNPLYFVAHAMWVKWWYHAKFQPFQSSFQMLFNFMVLYLKIINKWMKNNKWSQKGLKIGDVALNNAFWTQKNYGVQISSK